MSDNYDFLIHEIAAKLELAANATAELELRLHGARELLNH
jgi:hypothetical protein